MKMSDYRLHLFFKEKAERTISFPAINLSDRSPIPGVSISELSVSLGRDRIGHKSFFFFIDNTELYISDKISRIAGAHNLQLAPDSKSVCELLSYRYISGERTLFKAISKVPPGYLYTFFFGLEKWETVSSRTDVFNFESDTSIKNESEFHIRFATLLQNSIKSLQSDSTNLFFSGGLDSSLIASFLHPKCTGYCAGVDNATYDESEYASSAAEDIDIQVSISKIASSGFVSSVKNAISRTEMPLPVIQLAMYNDLMGYSDIPEGTIVAGYGADYILGESQRKYWTALHFGLGIPQLLLGVIKNVSIFSGKRRKEQAEKLYTFLSGIKAGQTWNSMISSLDPPSSPAISAQALGLTSIPDIHSHRRRLLGEENPQYITQQVFVTYSNLISATLSSWSSLCSSYDLDLETPFLERKLVDMITSVHPDLYLSFASDKQAISLLANRVLPKHLVKRPKKSSLLPPKFWLNENTPGLYEVFERIKTRNIVDIDYLLNRKDAFSRYGYIPVWSAINMEILFQFYESKGLVIQ
jgi:asparagine synthase (glutamine-hydrolysing)